MSERPENTQKLLSCLGLCVRAGKVTFGVPMICEALRKGGRNAPLIVLEAADTSENTHKKISDKCGYYKVRLIKLETDGAILASAIGKSSFVAAVAITDTQLCCLAEQYIRLVLFCLLCYRCCSLWL